MEDVTLVSTVVPHSTGNATAAAAGGGSKGTAVPPPGMLCVPGADRRLPIIPLFAQEYGDRLRAGCGLRTLRLPWACALEESHISPLHMRGRIEITGPRILFSLL